MYILLKNLPVVPCARIEWVGECNETVKKAGGVSTGEPACHRCSLGVGTLWFAAGTSSAEARVRMTEARSPGSTVATTRMAPTRCHSLPPLVGPSTSPVNCRHSARAPASELADDWTPRRSSHNTRTPTSTPGFRRSVTYPKAERRSGDATIGLSVLRGELRPHASSPMGLTPSALQRLSASGETPGDPGDVPADGGSRRKPSGPTTRCSVLAAVRSRGARCGCTARPALPLSLPAAPADTELSCP